MNPEPVLTWLVSRLKAVPGLAKVADRIYPNRAPEGTGVPCLVWQVLDAPHSDKLDAGPATVGTIAVQLRIYATTALLAIRMREAARQAFDGMTPADMADTGSGEWRLEGTQVSDFHDTFDRETETAGALFVLHLHVAES